MTDTTNPHTSMVPDQSGSLVVLNLQQMLQHTFKMPSMLLAPIITEQGLVMLFAPAGIGKTHVALGMAYAVASGTTFLKWKAPTPQPVVYFDGEMPGSLMQERLADICMRAQACEVAPDMLRFITPDAQRGTMPDLASSEGQAVANAAIGDAKLVIIDNLACLVRSGKPNEVESWRPIQSWILEKRREGRAMLLVHHTGKGGDQRGSSAHIDVLDTAINLRTPSDHDPAHGARFEVHLTKARRIFGEDAKPFLAHLVTDGDVSEWVVSDLKPDMTEEVLALHSQDMSQREIAAALKIGVGTVNRHLQKARNA